MSHHHHHAADMGERRLILAVMVNLILTLVQIVGGVVAGSLALIADALHNFSDAASLGVALVARRVSRLPADPRRTFGYQRAEIVGALINLTALVLIAFYLISEAVLRFFDPQPVDGWIVIAVACVALVVDAATAFLTWKASKGSLNIRAAFLHNVSDALASVGVIIAGTLILLFNWMWTDLAATLVISAYILVQSLAMIKTTINILMQGVPEDLNVQEVAAAMASVGGVEDVHHIHIWQLDEHTRSLEAHVVIRESNAASREVLKRRLKDQLSRNFSIGHSTLEFESIEASTECCNGEGVQDCNHDQASATPGEKA